MGKTRWVCGLGLVLLVGCGGRVPNAASQTTAAMPSPTYSASPGYTSSPGYPAPTAPLAPSSPYGAQPGAMPNPGMSGGDYGVQATLPANTPPMTAKIDSKKNGVFLGMGAFKVTVSVSNPASLPQTGTLKVTITDHGKPIKDFSELVTVPPGQTVTRQYEDKRWKADNATVTITPQQQTGASYYGATGATGW